MSYKAMPMWKKLPYMLILAASYSANGSAKALVSGVQPEDEEVSAPFSTMAAVEATPELPGRFDWRVKNGGVYLPKIEVQGDCGACVSLAAAAALATTINIACDLRGGIELSPQYLFSCGGGHCQGGWKLSDAVNFLVDPGVPDAGCLPYQAGNGKDVDCAAACPNAHERLVKGVSYERPTTGIIDVAEIKRALAKGPLLANMILFEDLQAYKSGVYRHKTGNQVGAHAVVLVGWDDGQQAWIARNSWGATWGDGGYFLVAWDDASLPGRYTYLFDVSKAKDLGACLQTNKM